MIPRKELHDKIFDAVIHCNHSITRAQIILNASEGNALRELSERIKKACAEDMKAAKEIKMTFEPKTKLGKELWALRQKIIAEGGLLIRDENEIIQSMVEELGECVDETNQYPQHVQILRNQKTIMRALGLLLLRLE